MDAGKSSDGWRNPNTVLAVIGICLTVATGSLSYQLTSIEDDRHESEDALARATDFTMQYFASTCAQRSELSDFPLDQWMNWRSDDRLVRYTLADHPDLYAPVPHDETSSGPAPGTHVAGVSVERGDDQILSPIGAINDAIELGYARDLAEPIPATTETPITSACLGGRDDRRNRIEPEIPTQIVHVTPIGDAGQVEVVVTVAEDRKHQDHVADKRATYAMRLVRVRDAFRLKSIAGLTLLDENANLLREMCAPFRAQVELDPKFPAYPKDGRDGVAAKCQDASPG